MKTANTAHHWPLFTAVGTALIVVSAAFADRPIDFAAPYIPPTGVHPYLSFEQILLIDPATSAGTHYIEGSVNVYQNSEKDGVIASLASQNLGANLTYSIWWIFLDSPNCGFDALSQVGVNRTESGDVAAQCSLSQWGGQLIANSDGAGGATVELKGNATQREYLGNNVSGLQYNLDQVSVFLALSPQ